MNDTVLKRLEDKAEQLITERKANKAPADYPGKKDLLKFKPFKTDTIGTAVVSSAYEHNVLLYSTEDGEQVLRTSEGENRLTYPGPSAFVPLSNQLFIQGDSPAVVNI